ncbi:hypothetical protein [Kitasatospora brasiliensis]|uniref:hypothetical protein n=1 Tax=Kitasatospora brasiliensis TaxID=3058040 RepID=UPI00292F7809|nr:hypothetical protein [Kitasatospora sp. K002]
MRPLPLPMLWLRGVAANPATPSKVLLRLLAARVSVVWPVVAGARALPADVAEVAATHPETRVRGAFARNRHVAPELRGRLAGDPHPLVRAALAAGPRPHLGIMVNEPLPDDALETLLTAQDEEGKEPLLTAGEIRRELGFSGQIPQSFRRGLARHPNPELRVTAVDLWPMLTPAERDALLADPVASVAEAARAQNRTLDPGAMRAELPDDDCGRRSYLLTNCAVSVAVAEQCLAERRDLGALAHNRLTPAAIVARLARDPDPKVREQVAARADLTADLLAELAQDPEGAVRARARLQPLPRTWPQCVAVDRVLGNTACCLGRVGEMFLEPATDWYEACVRSEEPVLRQVAATCARLSPESVRRLADDADPEVRHLLALNHPLAPSAIVLDAFLALPCQRPYLLMLRGLPRTGLGHLLDHPAPEVRALAAADPGLDRPPVHFLTDPEAQVRRAAAANPLLPLDLVETLLDDPESAEAAAANPRLPLALLHALLDRSGLVG